MQMQPFETMVPVLLYSMRWERKAEFLYREDRYLEWTMFAVESGSFSYEIEGEAGIASFGDIILCPPAVLFRREVVAPPTFYDLRFYWQNQHGEAMEPDPNDPRLRGKKTVHNNRRLLHNYERMKRLRAVHRFNRVHVHYLRDLWVMYQEELELQQERANEEAAADPLMEEAAEMIRSRALMPFDLKEVAAELGLSAARFTQKFKQAYGQTPIQYVTDFRLEKAKQLLLETRMTLEQISACIGYQNGYYLNRLFRKQLGTTPAQFRHVHRL